MCTSAEADGPDLGVLDKGTETRLLTSPDNPGMVEFVLDVFCTVSVR